MIPGAAGTAPCVQLEKAPKRKFLDLDSVRRIQGGGGVSFRPEFPEAVRSAVPLDPGDETRSPLSLRCFSGACASPLLRASFLFLTREVQTRPIGRRFTFSSYLFIYLFLHSFSPRGGR